MKEGKNQLEISPIYSEFRVTPEEFKNATNTGHFEVVFD